MLRKSLAVAVILLFIGVALAPSINANVVKDDFVEFDVEFCGLGKKHTISLTQQEADEVELLFDEIEQRLSQVETREEAEMIFNDAIVELDKYGFIGELSVEQAQRLVTGEYQNTNIIKLLERRYKYIGKDVEEDENILCLVSGETTYTMSFGPFMTSFFAISYIFMKTLIRLMDIFNSGLLNDYLGLLFIVSYGLLAGISLSYYGLMQYYPYNIVIGHSISYGASDYWNGDFNSYPSKGWINTIGLKGVKKWNGTFYGQLSRLLQVSFYGLYCGITGFTGIRTALSFGDNFSTFIMGSALRVKLGPEVPYV